MTQFVFANNVNTTLASAVSNTATSVTLASSANLPTLSAGQVMPLTLNDAATGQVYEIMYVTAISGPTLTVQRAQEGTGAQNWNTGDYAFCAFTAQGTATATGNPNNAFMTGPATTANQAPQFGQISGVVGQSRNLSMSVAAASATATLTADEIIVESALGGLRYCLPSFSKTINLATTGAGGMDTGSAPASGFVAIYAIYNPTTQTAALLATNATSAVAPSVYGGTLPSGYTASGLVSVWRTNASSQFVAGMQQDRRVITVPVSALSTTTQQTSYTALSLSSIVPLNAKSIDGDFSSTVAASGAASISLGVASTSSQIGLQLYITNNNWSQTGQGFSGTFSDLMLASPQTMYYVLTLSAGSISAASININGYTF